MGKLAKKSTRKKLSVLIATLFALSILTTLLVAVPMAGADVTSGNSQETIPDKMPPGTIITYDQNNQMIIEKPDYNSLFKEKQPRVTELTEEEQKKFDAEEKKVLEEIEKIRPSLPVYHVPDPELPKPRPGMKIYYDGMGLPTKIEVNGIPFTYGTLWGQVKYLNYLFWTADEKLEGDVKKLQLDLSLTDKQMEKLKELGFQEHYLYSEALQCKDDSATFNQRVYEVFANIDKEIKVVLGEKYNDFCKWIKIWWENEKTYRLNWLEEKEKEAKEKIGITSTDDRELVYATQYDGYTSQEIALPDKYVKFANLGWWDDIPDPIEPHYSNPPYTANVYYEPTNKSVLNVLVWEVGPWNEDDNYWDSATAANPRRMFTDLALGEPEAEAAYLWEYNDGKDQFGRLVTKPAGVNLTTEVAAQLGLGYLQNAWVWVRYSDLP